MTDKRIVFRADGNARIGLGHVMRCTAIAEMVGTGRTLTFAIQQPTPAVRDLLHRFDLIVLPETTDYQADAALFASQLTSRDVVVLDGYSFQAAYQRAIKQTGSTLVAVDDLAAWHQYADVVINHGGMATREVYQAEPYTQFLLGTDYALLRKPILEAATHRSGASVSHFRPKTILVNLGGADPDNCSLRVVNSLLTQAAIDEIHVILGAANPHRASFESLRQQGVRLLVNLSPQQMVDSIRACDLAVVSCSTVSYEVATVGRPFVGIITADNQIGLRDFYNEQQIALRVLEKDFAPADLTSVLQISPSEVNQSLTNQARFFDGQSGKRIGTLFETLAAS
ncbi:UDP-2,4-diacetamido-2,4,6-trideoxy-beta-L-altropyranose hydrolase [Spirosoma sp. KUDC1026]|uniref:UDP-2,4-diacetamido-2,4, 6-trideoxy-beta-L-altropyranose hydrolase n=1 Tax=Spirosoma sp. KUDC1026 TaxID=2745947 RepID=UPI00159BD103|nr:UDP-2,4-diacetamido-2,4,6-trideoxy-beta-L-altropyranose hydrolase [Spirosoma sp. KUDC1026]QKZ12249.1 UDP-2,4-diacetamido-2,4,6-trideoxy-beta-L-altropyranose hydrolase [Spirosoma sp. KUDC1026]